MSITVGGEDTLYRILAVLIFMTFYPYQVNYRENGMVQGAVVQKYLLEKSRIVSQV